MNNALRTPAAMFTKTKGLRKMYRILIIIMCWMTLSGTGALAQDAPPPGPVATTAEKQQISYRKQRRLDRIMRRKGLQMPTSELDRQLQIRRAIRIRNTGSGLVAGGSTLIVAGSVGIIGGSVILLNFCDQDPFMCIAGFILSSAVYAPSFAALAIGIGVVGAGTHYRHIGRSHLMRLGLPANALRNQFSIRPVITPRKQGLQLAFRF